MGKPAWLSVPMDLPTGGNVTVWNAPYMGDRVGNWLVVSTERSHDIDKFISILMNVEKELYRVTFFTHNRPWEKMIAIKDFPDFTTAVREYEKNLG